jgi:hypothetical protein
MENLGLEKASIHMGSEITTKVPKVKAPKTKTVKTKAPKVKAPKTKTVKKISFPKKK